MCEVCGSPLSAAKGRVHTLLDIYVAECGDPLCREGLSDRLRRAFQPLAALASEPEPRDHGPLPGALPPSPFASLTE